MLKTTFTTLAFVALIASFGCDLDPPAPRGADAIANVLVPTDDGGDAYRFRFLGNGDGPVLTQIDTPLGHREPVIRQECALVTYLRVADSDAEVPTALLDDCPGWESEEELNAVPVTGAPIHVRELRAAGFDTTLSKGPIRRCSKAEFEDDLAELQQLAEYQPIVNANCTATCNLWVAWNTLPTADIGCAFYDGDWNFKNNCSPADLNLLLLQYGAAGIECLDVGAPVCDQIPDPNCDHQEWVIGDWGPYGFWKRTSAGTGVTTRVRTDITNCDRESVFGLWQSRESVGGAWSAQVPFSVPGNKSSTLVLSAGWDGYDNWRGWDFSIEAEGNEFHVATAWVEYEGRNRFTCPLLL